MKPVEQKTEKMYWRSLDQLQETPEFRQFVEREFPEGASEMTSEVDRRRFLLLMAAGIGMAGLTACRRPIEKIIPAGGKLTEQIIPGSAQYYATIFNFGGQAQGLLVRSNDGRPTKIEGNPNHPSSLGATSGFAQATILDMYDPDRSKFITKDKQKLVKKEGETEIEIGHEEFDKFAASHFTALKNGQGAGLRFLAESNSSPSLRELRDHLTKTFPQAKWVTYDAVLHENMLAGANIAFGQPAHVHYAFDKADVILALDSDFLGCDTGSTLNVKNFSKKRRTAELNVGAVEHSGHETAAPGEKAAEHKTEGWETEHKAEVAKAGEHKEEAKAATGESGSDINNKMNRLYAVESNFTVTGAMADHRLRLQSHKIGGFLAALAQKLGLAVAGLDQHKNAINGYALASKWIDVVAKDLTANKGKAVIVVGNRQPAHIHALAHLINASLAGEVVKYTRGFEDKFESSLASLKDLTAEMEAGKVTTLVILGANPVYNAPADLKFRDALKKVPTKIHHGLYQDETAIECNWHVNEAHFLESWGDGRAYDGTASIQQPLVAPLYNGTSAIEFLAGISGYPQTSGYEIIKTVWAKSASGKAWDKIIHDGVQAGSGFTEAKLTANAGSIGGALAAAPVNSGEFELNFVTDASMYDGRFANNGWMQEVPDPMTKLVWDNAALISKDTAEKIGVKNEDVVKLTLDGHELNLPIWIMPGHAKDSISVALGYGRTNAGRIGNNIGGNAYLLRSSNAMDFSTGVKISKTGETYKIATTNDHWSMEGRELVREATLEDFVKSPALIKEKVHEEELISIYPNPQNYSAGNQWGMAIDLNTCVGCNACVLACQSENNIPIVGKTQVLKGREMHWIRMDRYFTNVPKTEFAVGGAKPWVFNEDYMQAVQQPMTCQQCENAPCEEVCPVAATVHNEEGLNTMAYNRCVGTRYCSNNCPFKVRRFNYLNFHKDITDSEKMGQNPDVTVRMRGVMEKCTYCVQRIQTVKIQAKVEGHRPIKDGEITPACAQACPADSIIFGNINDPESRVAKLKKQARDYQLLTELNVKPRTSYLARFRNPNKELVAG